MIINDKRDGGYFLSSEVEEMVKKEIDSIEEVTVDELSNSISEELIDANFESIIEDIKKFIKAVQVFEEKYAVNKKVYVESSNTAAIANVIQKEVELIYDLFFQIQNEINAFVGQRIVMTYVHINKNGHREIRISDNDINHIAAVYHQKWWGGTMEPTYIVAEGYKKLKNTLPEENNRGLQDTAQEITRRYQTYKKKILWYVGKWKGYTMRTLGPINEAFVNFYVHSIELKKGTEENIDTYMLDDNYGAIKADATKGFMIGDVQNESIQYAVKGIGGSPQGYKDVYNSFLRLQEEKFSKAAFLDMIKKYTTDEEKRKLSPQIKELAVQDIPPEITSLEQMTKKMLSNLVTV